jgi:hypothetical protein
MPVGIVEAGFVPLPVRLGFILNQGLKRKGARRKMRVSKGGPTCGGAKALPNPAAQHTAP